MTKTELIAKMGEVNGLTKKENVKIIDDLISIAESSIKENGLFKIPDFFEIKVLNKPARQMKSPSTGEILNVPAKSVLKAKAIGKMKKILS